MAIVLPQEFQMLPSEGHFRWDEEVGAPIVYLFCGKNNINQKGFVCQQKECISGKSTSGDDALTQRLTWTFCAICHATYSAKLMYMKLKKLLERRNVESTINIAKKHSTKNNRKWKAWLLKVRRSGANIKIKDSTQCTIAVVQYRVKSCEHIRERNVDDTDGSEEQT